MLVPKFKDTDSELNLNTNNREKRGILFSITGLAYKGVSAHLNWMKNQAIESGYQAILYYQNIIKIDYTV